MCGLTRNPSSGQARRRMSWQGLRRGLQLPIASQRKLHMQGPSPWMSQPQVCSMSCIGRDS